MPASGSAKIDEVDLDELRRVGEEAHVAVDDAAHPCRRRTSWPPRQRADQHAAAEREEGDLQREPRAAEQAGKVRPDLAELRGV